MQGSTFTFSWWRLPQVKRHPMVRAVDRVETAVLVIMVAVALLSVPVAAQIGASSYARSAAEVARETATMHQTSAVLLTDSTTAMIGGNAPAMPRKGHALARWQSPTGGYTSARVPAVAGTKAGTTVRIWLDPMGRPTDAPKSHTEIMMDAIGVSLFVVGVISAMGFILFVSLRTVFDRLRFSRWEREWQEMQRGKAHW